MSDLDPSYSGAKLHPADQEIIRLRSKIEELTSVALNWRGNFVMLANTINPEEDKPALVAAKELVAERDSLQTRVAELENAGTVVMRLLLQGHKDEALAHLQSHFQA